MHLDKEFNIIVSVVLYNFVFSQKDSKCRQEIIKKIIIRSKK